MIASPHNHSLEFKKENVHIGKTSRIQDGYLVRLTSLPKTKYEGCYVIVGPCYLNRIYDDQFQISGLFVEKFLHFWFQDIIFPIAQSFAPDSLKNFQIPKFSFVHTENTRWFVLNKNSNNNTTTTYVTNNFFDTNSYGFAVIMTRGPWFHISKNYMTSKWNLVEWIQIN